MIPKSEVVVDRKRHVRLGKRCAWWGGGGVLLVFTHIESDVKGEF